MKYSIKSFVQALGVAAAVCCLVVGFISSPFQGPKYADATYAGYMDMSLVSEGDTTLLVSDHEWVTKDSCLTVDDLSLAICKEGEVWYVTYEEKAPLMQKDSTTFNAKFENFELIMY